MGLFDPLARKRQISDVEMIAMLEGEMTGVLVEVTEIVQAAKEAGFVITYATGEVAGRQEVTHLSVVKAR